MKIAIMTFVRAYNYGAVLQAYALNKIINEFGIECETIDYYPDYFRDLYSFRYLGKIRTFPPYRPIGKWLEMIDIKKSLLFRNKGFETFINNNIKLSDKQYHKCNDLVNCKYDRYISGSDQVWNYRCTDFDEAFFLTFADNDKKYSYAASFGFDSIPDNKVDEYRKRLLDWSGYSVREYCAVNILYELLGGNINCKLSCDPTLLLDKKQWQSIQRQPKKLKIPKKFLLVYFVKHSERLLNYAKDLSKSMKISVICVTSPLGHQDLYKYRFKENSFINASACSPEEYLYLFSNAEYVLTNSFHGTVFSIIYNKLFLTEYEFSDGAINNRVVNILNELGINRNIISCSIDEKIYWENVNKEIANMREESIEYLRRICFK